MFTGGEQMGAPVAVNVPAASPNQEVNVSINLVAPLTGGNHIGYWQLRNPQGTYFGDRLWVSLRVPDGSIPGSNADVTLSCLNCPTNVAPGATFRPTIRATVNRGQLVQSRGDMLRNTDGNLFGAHPHIAVTGMVNAGESYDFTFYSDNPLKAPSGEGTHETHWRVWRDGNYVGEEITIRFDTRAGGNNRRPNRPDPESPGDWHVQWDGGQVRLCARNNGDPDGDPIIAYAFEVKGAQNWNSGEVGSNCVTTSGLGFYTFGWRVKVKDSRGEWSDLSDPEWRFTIHNPAAIQGIIFSPSSPGSPDTVKVWACSNGGTNKYYVNLANDGSGNGQWWQFNEGPICGDPEHDEPEKWPGWQTRNYTDGPHLVRVENGLGGMVQDVYVLLPRRPAPPDLLNPPHQSFQPTRTIEFNWGHGMHADFPTRATSYTLKVSTDPDPGNSPVLNVTVASTQTSYSHTFDQDYQTLYWQVTADNAQGTSKSGDIFRFGIDRQKPQSVVASLPNAATDSTVVVNWSGTDNLAGIRWFDVQYRDDARDNWIDWQADVTLAGAIFVGRPGHRYCFRARAYDRAGNEEDWPAAANGDTCTTLDPAAAPPTAWWNNGYATKRNLVVLNNDSDPLYQGYPVHLHFDSGTSPSSAELFAASQSATKGDDFRIIHNNTTELARWVQRFSASEIDIWFRTAVTRGGNESDGSYQLYYGNANAANPLGDIDDVMPPGQDANTVGVWHFAEDSGTTLYDSSGRAHNGNLVGSFSRGEDSFGPYLEWFGGGDGQGRGEVPSSSDFDLSQFTIEAWIYSMDGATAEMTLLYRPLSAPWENNCPGYKLAVGGSNLEFHVNCASGKNSGGSYNMNVWTHVAATYDGSNLVIYRNGSPQLTVAYSEAVRSTAGSMLYLGGSPWSQTYRGRIRHLRLSNVARTDFSASSKIAAIGIAPTVAAGEEVVPPSPGAAELVLLDLRTTLNPEGEILVEATFRNEGDKSTVNGFFTDLYLDHLPTGTGDYRGSVQFWVNDPVEPGATITVVTTLPDVAALRARAFGVAQPAGDATAVLYAQVDSTGVVKEDNNTDNIYVEGTEVCTTTPDSFENDDVANAAVLLAPAQTQAHNFDLPRDADWIKFNAQMGTTYVLKTLNLGAAADTYLYLYGTNGTTLLASNDDVEGTLASTIEWTPPANGTYYARVEHWNRSAGGCKTGYDLTLTTVSWPDLTPVGLYQVAYALVPSLVKDSTLYEPPLYADYPSYLDGHIGNLGAAGAAGEIVQFQVLVNGLPVVTNELPLPDLNAAESFYDVLLGSLDPGSYTFTFVVDPNDLVEESNEDNNVWEHTFTWEPVDGWWGEYYANPDLAGDPVFVRDDEYVDFNWGEGSPAPPVPADNFSVRWTRESYFEAGTYLFQINRDDGARLRVGTWTLFDRWYPAAESVGFFYTFDTAGTHMVTFEMFEAYEGALAYVNWHKVPNPPELYDISNEDGDGKFTVSWLGVASATGYVLNEQYEWGDWNHVQGGTETSFSAVDKADGRWCYRVRVYTNSIWPSEFSEAKCTVVGGNGDTTQPSISWIGPVEALGVYNVYGETVRLEADASDNVGVASVRFERWDVFSAEWLLIGTDNTSPYRANLNTSDLNPGCNTIMATAVDSAANIDTSTIEVCLLTLDPPALTVDPPSPNRGDYTLQWLAVQGATGYQIQEKHGSEEWQQIFEGQGTSVARSDMAQGEYCYRGRAVREELTSTWSDPECVTVDPTLPAPVPPALYAIDNDMQSPDYQVWWTSSEGADAYELRERHADEAWNSVYEGPNLAYAAAGRADGEWCYQVRASNSAGVSNWSEAACTTVNVAEPGPRLYLPVVFRNQ